MSTVESSLPAVETGAELGQMVAELLRAGWQLQFQPKKNDWGGVAQGVVTFSRMEVAPRTPQEDVAALRRGLPTYAPFHSHFDLFDPQGLYKVVKRFHRRFVERRAAA